jgi:KDO2-lipid IV(A) lauroyltransferase
MLAYLWTGTSSAIPLIAILARQSGAPDHGLRVVRNPGGNSFWGDISDEVKPVRDAEGRINIAAPCRR